MTLPQNVIELWQVRESVPLHCWRALGHLTTQKGGLRCVLQRGMSKLDVGMSRRRADQLEFSLAKAQGRRNSHESETIWGLSQESSWINSLCSENTSSNWTTATKTRQNHPESLCWAQHRCLLANVQKYKACFYTLANKERCTFSPAGNNLPAGKIWRGAFELLLMEVTIFEQQVLLV